MRTSQFFTVSPELTLQACVAGRLRKADPRYPANASYRFMTAVVSANDMLLRTQAP